MDQGRGPAQFSICPHAGVRLGFPCGPTADGVHAGAQSANAGMRRKRELLAKLGMRHSFHARRLGHHTIPLASAGPTTRSWIRADRRESRRIGAEPRGPPRVGADRPGRRGETRRDARRRSLRESSGLAWIDPAHHQSGLSRLAFSGAACATTAVERLTHHAEIVSIEGTSYRLEEVGKRAKALKPTEVDLRRCNPLKKPRFSLRGNTMTTACDTIRPTTEFSMSWTKGLWIGAGALAGGALAVVAAPVVLPMLGAAGVLGAAGTGTMISTLGGAALASASGAVVTGTVAGTTAVVGAGGAAVGAAAAAAAVRKKRKA